MLDISMIKFDADGLVPAVVQEENGQVLMLAYMNAESLQKTLETRTTWFWSRSRQELWNKGATSGNMQQVKDMYYDCDGDTILVIVHQQGSGACHTGTYSCFSGRRLMPNNKALAVVDQPEPDKYALAGILNELYDVIKDRQLNPKEGSYTNYLFEKGQDKILKKVGEEAVETVIASKNLNKEEIIYEMGDLWYHCLVLLAYHNIKPEEVFAELINRHNGGDYHKFTGKTGIRSGETEERSEATSVVNSPIDDAFSGTDFFDTLLENETYHSQYEAYLQQLVSEYINGGGFDAFYERVRGQIDELVETDPTAFYSYDEYETAAETLYQVVKLRGQSIQGQLDGTIPSTEEAQRDSDALIDASDLDVSVMGTMNMGGGNGKAPAKPQNESN